VLSNVQYEIEMLGKGVDFDDPSWRAWISRRQATVLPGVVAFLERVHGLGGRVALVTNRDEDQRADIEANLREQGVPFDLLLPKPSPGQSDKAPRWTAVEKGTAAAGVPPLAILLFVGDNIKDFPGLDQSVRNGGTAALAPFGDRFIVVPNPMYGSWKSAAPQPMASPKPQ
jgi:5'-nucleotidase (lipoprotein e(P4) family)